jgi:penicillin-binding protein A
LKKQKKKKKTHVPVRLNMLFFIVFLLFSTLILRLGIVQIVYGEDYRREVERTEDVTVNTPVPRGRIYDRHYNVIVDNTPLNAITYTRTNSTKVDEMLEVAEKLAKFIKKNTKEVTERDKKDFWILKFPDLAQEKITEEDKQKLKELDLSQDEYNKKLYQLQLDRITEKDLAMLSQADLEVLAIFREFSSGYALTPQMVKNEGVTSEEFAKVSEHLDSLPGVDTTTDWDREYVYGQTLKTILGEVSTAKEGLPREKLDYYLSRDYSRNDRVGTSYIEQQYEDVLRGQKEKIKNITDKSGNVIDSELVQEGQRGKDLVLTIDIELQLAVEKIIEEELLKAKKLPNTSLLDRAFVVLMDPFTGEILSLAGKQYAIDPNTGQPLLKDFALGTFTTSYTMGSAVKGATILTGYQLGAITPGDKIYDQPLKIKDTPLKKSWKNFGLIDDITALKVSSNVYMFQTAIRIGGGVYRYNQPLVIDTDAFSWMRQSFSQFGLGVRTGIDLPNEQIGFKGPYEQAGLLLDLAIGQYDTYTPLQMAQYVSTIANGGYRIQPHIVKEIREPNDDNEQLGPIIEEIQPKVLNILDVDPTWMERVQEGFRQVMQEPGGTAYSFFADAPYSPAGKTGTAEAFYDGPRRKEFEGPPPQTTNLTLVAYAPYDKPEIAMAVVVPWAYQKSVPAVTINKDIGRRVLDAYFELKQKRMANQQQDAIQYVNHIEEGIQEETEVHPTEDENN